MTDAGWYSDPGTPGQLRYWDGTAWTAHVQPSVATPPPVVPRAVTPSSRRTGSTVAVIAIVALVVASIVGLVLAVRSARDGEEEAVRDQAQDRACLIEVRTLRDAAQAFTSNPDLGGGEGGRAPVNAQQLLDAGLIEALPMWHRLEGEGSSVAITALGRCVGSDDGSDRSTDPDDPSPRSNVDPEQRSACLVEDRTLKTAAEAFVAMNGTPPRSVDDLVASSLLVERPQWHTLSSDGTSYIVTGTGVCEGVG